MNRQNADGISAHIPNAPANIPRPQRFIPAGRYLRQRYLGRGLSIRCSARHVCSFHHPDLVLETTSEINSAASLATTAVMIELKPNDAQVYFAVAIVLGMVTLAATYVPARGASKIDPLAAIRQE